MRRLLFSLIALAILTVPALSSADEPVGNELDLNALQFRLIPNDDESPVFSRSVSTQLIDPNQHILAIKDPSPVFVAIAPGQVVPWKLIQTDDAPVFRTSSPADIRKQNTSALRRSLKWQHEIKGLLEAAHK